MPKPRNVIPSVFLTLALPSDLHMKLSLHLFSELDGRVPQGAYMRFIGGLLREYFAQAHLDLAEWTGAEAGEQVVHGEAATIATLHETLQNLGNERHP